MGKRTKSGGKRGPRSRANAQANSPGPGAVEPVGLRIVGGTFRGRKLEYSGLRLTRPMQHRIREAAFNLVGPRVKGMHAVDLFAGTGALGLEAISRGAASATFVERHFPTAAGIERNLELLNVRDAGEIAVSDTFIWFEREPELPADRPWAVFCSPPYDLYFERSAALHNLLTQVAQRAPAGSVILAEFDTRLESTWLPEIGEWDVRKYGDTLLAMWVKQELPAD